MMAVKKKTATKAKKTKPKRKTAAARKTRAGRTITVVFQCDGNACTPSVNPAHMSMGDTVVLEAQGTKVDLDFSPRSPFTLSFFSIAKNKSVSAGVMQSRGRFPYTVTCGACTGTRRVPPEFIIP